MAQSRNYFLRCKTNLKENLNEKNVLFYQRFIARFSRKKVLICFRYRIKNMSIIGKLTSNSYTDYGGPYFATNKYISIIFYREDVKEIYKTNKNITIII